MAEASRIVLRSSHFRLLGGHRRRLSWNGKRLLGWEEGSCLRLPLIFLTKSRFEMASEEAASGPHKETEEAISRLRWKLPFAPSTPITPAYTALTEEEIPSWLYCSQAGGDGTPEPG